MTRISMALCLCVLLSISACTKGDKKEIIITYDNGPTDSLKINQVQVMASHNSYHHKTDTAVFNLLVYLNDQGFLPSQYDPKGIDYDHLPLQEQLSNYTIRGLELDIYNDPLGGHYYNRQGYYFLGKPTASNIPELMEPGFKMIHILDFDFVSTNYTFKGGLKDVKIWSDAHPNHLPLFINIETKQDAPADQLSQFPNLTKAVPWDASSADSLDAEIKSVFGADLSAVITPDNVRGTYATLEAAALAKNWPTLAKARGKVIFIMQGAAESVYKAGHSSLAGRACFVYSNPGTPEAAFVILNDPVPDHAEIMQRVGQGYIVRTRADSNTDEARSGDYTNMNSAFDSWAQIVSTDYYRADPRAGTTGWTDYHVSFPGGVLARINGISAADKVGLGLIKE